MQQGRSHCTGQLMFVAVVLLITINSGITQQASPPLLSSFFKLLAESLGHMNSEPPDQSIILKEYDFIVVGAGSAGSVVANRLTEIPEWKVLLIEAGEEENYLMDIPILANLLQFSDANWKYKTVPSNKYCLGMENNRCKFPRGKVMGGCSVLNYMIYTRGNWRDYDKWAKMGNEGWDYHSVLKYFKKVEDLQIPRYVSNTKYRSTGGYQTISEVPYHSKSAKAFIEGGRELGYPTPDINAATQIGFSYHQVTMRNGTRCSTSKAYLHPIRNRRNLHVKKRGMVTRILIDPQTKTAYGIEFIRNKRNYKVLARKEVIISAGAINSPQLLMVSGVGPRQHLQAKGIPVLQDLPVGYNLMDHVALGGLTFMLNDTASLIADRFLDDINILHDFYSEHKGPMAIPGGTEAMSFHDLEDPANPDGHPDVELLFISGTMSSEVTLRRSFGVTDQVYDSVFKATEGLDGIMLFPMIMRPRSRGRIMLRDSNTFHHPLIYPNYFDDERDLDILVKGVRISQQLAKTKAMRHLRATLLPTPLPGCNNITFDSDEYWKCHARNLPFTIYHLSGTCKMAPQNDKTGVVDPRLRVKGVKRLRVADASIMPEIPSAHINAPAIMIGEKASDMIKEDWNRRTDLTGR